VTDDPGFYDRALARMDRIAIVLGAAAALLFFVRQGWRGAAGCTLAACASIYNLRRLRALAARLGNAGSSGSAVLAGLRFLLLGLLCFVIIKFFGVSAVPVFAGLLVSVAAVLIELLYELIVTR
jgi:hypothetical protein